MSTKQEIKTLKVQSMIADVEGDIKALLVQTSLYANKIKNAKTATTKAYYTKKHERINSKLKMKINTMQQLEAILESQPASDDEN